MRAQIPRRRDQSINTCMVCSCCALCGNAVDMDDAYVENHGNLISIVVLIERTNTESKEPGERVYSVELSYIHRIKITYNRRVKE